MSKADLLVIRHGKTEYTDTGLDLTSEGVEETIRLAQELSNEIEGYDKIIVASSPAIRAIGTAKVFLEQLGLECRPEVLKSIRPVGIFDIESFRKFEAENSTEVYGEMWFTNSKLESDNILTEGRERTNSRALRFLGHISYFLAKKVEEEKKSICLIIFTHFEIATNYLRPLYPTEIPIPSRAVPGIRNSEAIIISIDSKCPRKITIKSRGLAVEAVVESDRLISETEA